jgi:hypothetical protein
MLFVLLSFFFPTLFVLALAGTIYLKSVGGLFSDIEEFKTALEIVQTSFAVYLGLPISSLFEMKITEPRGANRINGIITRGRTLPQNLHLS